MKYELLKLTPKESQQERELHKKRILHNCKWNFSYERLKKMGYTEHGIKLPPLPPNTYVAFRTYRKLNKRKN